MTITDRMKVSAALWAVLILIIGILSIFFADLQLMLHSQLFWFLFTAGTLVVAPAFARYLTRGLPAVCTTVPSQPNVRGEARCAQARGAPSEKRRAPPRC